MPGNELTTDSERYRLFCILIVNRRKSVCFSFPLGYSSVTEKTDTEKNTMIAHDPLWREKRAARKFFGSLAVGIYFLGIFFVTLSILKPFL